MEYKAKDFLSQFGTKDPALNMPATIHEGMEYSAQGNCKRYNFWAGKYNDTSCKSRDKDMETYRPHPYGITRITMRIPHPYNDPYRLYMYVDKNGNEVIFSQPEYHRVKYPFGSDCTSLFKIRYRSYYEYIQNGYSWEGLEQAGPWYEMELKEFNARGGAKMMDISEFYLIAKERPQYDLTAYSPWGSGSPYMVREFDMDMTFDNGKTNHKNRYLIVYSCF